MSLKRYNQIAQCDDYTYHQVAASSRISDVLEGFYFIENNSGKPIEFSLFPDGYIYVHIGLEKEKGITGNLSGLIDKRTKRTLSSDTYRIGLRFNPMAIDLFFKENVTSLFDDAQSIDLKDIGLNSDFLHEHWNSKSMLIDQIESDIQNRMMQANKNDRAINLLEFAQNNFCTLQIKDLANNAGISSKQVSRIFQRRLGVSAKKYLSFKRFYLSIMTLSEEGFGQYGFCDQSHFIKEFKNITGMTPLHLFDNNSSEFIQTFCYKKFAKNYPSNSNFIKNNI